MQALGLVWDNVDPLTADLREAVSPIPAPVHFGARLLYAHWRDLQKHDGLVVGRDVPSRHLSGILRNLAVFEPIDDLQDFRARLAGTAFLRRFGRDITGLKLSEVFLKTGFDTHRNSMAEIVRSRIPLTFDVKVQRGDRVFLKFEALRLPVFSPDRSGIWVLSGLFYHD
jgi:hypothetical protein